MGSDENLIGASFDPAQDTFALMSSFSQPLFDALALSARTAAEGGQGAGTVDARPSPGYLIVARLRPQLLWTVRTLRAGRAAITEGNLAVVQEAVDLVRREAADGPYDRIGRIVVAREMDEVQRWCTAMSGYRPGGSREAGPAAVVEALSFDMFRFASLLRLVGLSELAQGYDDEAMKLRGEPSPHGVEKARGYVASTFRYSGWGSITDRYVGGRGADGSVDEVLNDEYEELARKLGEFGGGGLYGGAPGPEPLAGQ